MAGKIVIDGEPTRTTGTASCSSSPTAAGWRCTTGAGSAARSIEPDFDHVGPDAANVSRDVFRERVGRGSMALKARLLDQRSISGVGNLLADETLWRAGSPRGVRPAS